MLTPRARPYIRYSGQHFSVCVLEIDECELSSDCCDEEAVSHLTTQKPQQAKEVPCSRLKRSLLLAAVVMDVAVDNSRLLPADESAMLPWLFNS